MATEFSIEGLSDLYKTLQDLPAKIEGNVMRGALRIGDRYVGPSVLHPGAAPKPFMRPAFDSANTQALTVVRDYIANRLPKEIAKQGR